MTYTVSSGTLNPTQLNCWFKSLFMIAAVTELFTVCVVCANSMLRVRLECIHIMECLNLLSLVAVAEMMYAVDLC